MKTIGLIGGMSWESSLEYYRIINEEVKHRLGGLHSAKSLMYSVDFAEIEHYQAAGEWDKATDVMVEAGKNLEAGGADCVVICTNTMHKMAPDIASNVKIPLIHIADATAEKIKKAGIHTIGLLGTIYTMEQDFYAGRLRDKFALNVLTPPKAEREIVNRVIYEELVLGSILRESRAAYKEIMGMLVENGAEGVILGCTEITLLVHPEDSSVPQFDTTLIHAQAAVDFALSDI